ncbi:MAG: phosphoethanolamine transferase [Paludibacteraceae bacterium]|nr:phosphoethanolamine transferase [Paludibacteraceae bacterium]
MKHTKKEIISNLLLLFLLLSANLYTLFFADALFNGAMDRVWYILVAAFGYSAGLLLLKQRTFFIIAGIAQMTVLPIEVSSLYLNGQPVSMPYMHWIISTNRNEAMELLSSVGWGVLAVVMVWCLYGWLVTCIPQKKMIQMPRKWVAWSILATELILLMALHASYLNKEYTAPNKRVYAGIYAWSFGMRMGQVFPYDIYLQTFRAVKHQREIDGIVSLSDYRFGITPRPDTDSAIYVLVIGEAARFHNFSLNGQYERETNPRLSRQPNLIFYTHAYAEANATDLSVPLMLTRATSEDPTVAYQEKTVCGAFQEAGYPVAWLSAESDPIRYLQHVLPTLDTTWIASGEVLDEALFEPFDGLIQAKEGTNLIILHTKGSHLNYQDRYPQSFALFEPCLKPGDSNGAFDKELMTNTYDNTILYTDFILDSLIQTLSATQRCACLIYMPDHGENLCDDERKLWVHGSYEGSEWEYHVPLIVWYSDSFKERYPDKVVALQANKDKQVSSQVLFHTLCDMVNLHEVVESHYSLFSDSLTEMHSIRVLNGKGELIEL